MNKKKNQPQQRKQHTADTHTKARKMFLRGLYLSEISILLNVPLRTLENWQTAEKWTIFKECEDIKKRAYEMQRNGKTYDKIAKTLDISKRTIARYIKTYKHEKELTQKNNT